MLPSQEANPAKSEEFKLWEATALLPGSTFTIEFVLRWAWAEHVIAFSARTQLVPQLTSWISVWNKSLETSAIRTDCKLIEKYGQEPAIISFPCSIGHRSCIGSFQFPRQALNLSIFSTLDSARSCYSQGVLSFPSSIKSFLPHSFR